MSKQVKRSKRQQKKGGRKGQGLLGERATTAMVIPKQMGWASSRLRVTLRYSTVKQILNAGAQLANVRYTPTYCYDVDPLLLTTSMPGFLEYAGIYRFYRTRSSSISVWFSNAEAISSLAYVCPVNFDPGSNASPNVFLQSSKLCKKTLLGPLTGNGIKTIKHAISTDVFTGVRDVGIADVYTAPTSGASSPANNWYWAVGIETFGLQVNGVDIAVDVDCEIEFFELTNPTG